jgi:Ca2+-dependent lipid-binding protein
MLDHQTWVESKLAEKFYGDWYHNTAVIIFACLASYVIALLGGGLAWVFLVMTTCGTYYRTSIRRVKRNFRDDVNRELQKKRIENDTESLEWMNNFLEKFWPIYAPVIADTVITSVDQVLSTATPALLDSMRMKFFTLGSKPPRMEHVRSYPKSKDDEVIMDWRFSFTPNDTADMTKRQIKNKINPKVILEIRIGKALVSKAMDIIVEDFAFSGIARIKLKLQVPFPHVERIEFCFLEPPTIDYVCKPLGGETLGFDIGFLPGLQSFIMDQIHANIGPIMYAPNVFPIEVAKMLSGNAVDKAIGVVAITLHRAQGLKNPDKFSGTPDPYVAISLNSREMLARTKTVHENANPVWNETKYIIVTSFVDTITMQVMDYNEVRRDKELGVLSFPLEKLQDNPGYENEQLEVIQNGKPRGIVAADIRFFPVLEAGEDAEGKPQPPPESNTGIARFKVEQVKELDSSKSLIGQLNPYAVLLLNNREIFVSKKLKRTNDPIWDSCYKEILITDRKTAKLGLVIKDDRSPGTDPILGTYQIKLDDMLRLMEKGQEWYQLAGAKQGRAKMTLEWKPVALTGVGAGTGGYVTPIGVMRVYFKNAREIRNLETVGKSDPYARVLLSGIEKGRTVTHKSNLNPDFEEVVYVPVHSEREKLTIEVMDEESMGKDRTLGQTEISVGAYLTKSDRGEWLVKDDKVLLSEGLRAHGKGGVKGTLNFMVSFFPCLNVADPEDKEEAEKERKSQLEAGKLAVDGTGEARKSSENGGKSIDNELAAALKEGEKEQVEEVDETVAPKLRLSPEELLKYDSGLVIFKLLDAELSETHTQVEVLVDDMLFPSYTSAVAKTKRLTFDEIGDCFIRELEFSKLTIRLREKGSGNEEDKDKTVARLVGGTLETLKQCLVCPPSNTPDIARTDNAQNNPTVLKLRDEKGNISSVRVSLKYIPVQMRLDPSESINNMGTLRVDVLDASDLPSADRNGYSDPYCKFELNGTTVFKTETQKKTLHPAWNEFFEVEVPSRTAAQFRVKVYDWDAVGDDDKLGNAEINLSVLEPFKPREFNLRLDGKSGTIRLRCLFRPSYITRSRQGSSTFSGTFAVPGKIVTGVAGAPIKGVGYAAEGVGAVAGGIGSGLGKGAKFITGGFRSKKDKESGAPKDSVSSFPADDVPNGSSGSPALLKPTRDAPLPPPTGSTPVRPVTSYESSSLSPAAATPASRSHTRGQRSVSGASIYSAHSGAPVGTAHFTIVSAEGFKPDANLYVVVKQLPKEKSVFKGKHLKAPEGRAEWGESFVVDKVGADVQYQVLVRDHATFGSDDTLGVGVVVVDETGGGAARPVKVGSGVVHVASRFTPRESNGAAGAGARDSPRGKGFLKRRESVGRE